MTSTNSHSDPGPMCLFNADSKSGASEEVANPVGDHGLECGSASKLGQHLKMATLLIL